MTRFLPALSAGLIKQRGVVAVSAATGLALLIGAWALMPSSKPAMLERTRSLPLPLPPPAPIEAPASATAAQGPEPTWQQVRVQPGQTLEQIFKGFGQDATVVHQVVTVDHHTRRLAKIYPGDELALRIDEQGTMQALEYQLDEATRLRVSRENGQDFRSDLIEEELAVELTEASGTIQNSLFLAGREAGLSDALIMEMAGLFGWDIDFVLDIRAGDSFYLIYEQIYRQGQYLRSGEIVGATFVNRGKKYRAIRFHGPNGVEYFAPDGRNMKKAFLRAPLNFAYISSNFAPSRFHPILKRWKAHNGIDYRAPSGTPVFAAGNGKVIASSYTKPNGNYVFIQHGNNIVTKYLHFSKRKVKNGQRVKQGQVIGYVGATGWATAPHLHYEFVVNGSHRNPRTVKLPKAEPLATAQMAEFKRVAQPIFAQLERIEQIQLLAQAAP